MVRFRCNLPNCTVKGNRFQGGFFETDDPEKIEYLRGYGMRGGILVEEVKAKPPMPSTPPEAPEGAGKAVELPTADIMAILAKVEVCETPEALDTLLAELEERYPGGQGFPEEAKETIGQAIEAKMKSFAAPETPTDGGLSTDPEADAILAEAKKKQGRKKG